MNHMRMMSCTVTYCYYIVVHWNCLFVTVTFYFNVVHSLEIGIIHLFIKCVCSFFLPGEKTNLLETKHALTDDWLAGVVQR